MKSVRTPYTKEEDTYLAKYIATYNPSKSGRSGNVLYKRLVENEDKKWPWSKHHTWQSWRQRYVDREERFDAKIRQYQKRLAEDDRKDSKDNGKQKEKEEEEEEELPSSPPKTKRPPTKDDDKLRPRVVSGKSARARADDQSASRKRKKGLDFNTDSDEEAAASGQKSTEMPWPPPRQKKLRGMEIENHSSLAESTPARKTSTTDLAPAATLHDASPAQLAKEKALFNEATIRSPHLEDVMKVTPPASPIHKPANGTVHSVTPSKKHSLAKKNEPKPSLPHVEPEPEIEPVAGPSKHNGNPEEPTDKARAIQEWRLVTPLSEGQAPSVSTSALSDPFLTADHVKRLRKGEKGKEREKKDNIGTDTGDGTEEKANRRMSFGGISTLGLPELDLRRKALRTSFAANPVSLDARRSFSSSSSSMEVVKRRESGHISNSTQSRRRTSSLATTIDLTLEFPAPGVSISPSDQVLVDRAGLQFFIQSMAENHSVSEEWVRQVYEEFNDLQATDRVVAKMRDAAEKAFEEAILDESTNVSAKVDADISMSNPRLSSMDRRAKTGNSLSAKPSPAGREVDLSMISAQPDRSYNRRRSELLYTPAELDTTLARVRDQYVPPSSSRAARYMRGRARTSSAVINSPLLPNGNPDELEQIGVADEGEEEKEEAEIMMSLTPAPKSFNSEDSEHSEYLDDMGASHEHVFLPTRENMEDIEIAPKLRSWTAEEDRVLLTGEDDDAIKEIIERRGKMAVKWRLVELDDATMLS